MIKHFRQTLGMSVNQLADFLHVNERTVRRWEYGELPTPHAVIMLLMLLQILVDNPDLKII